MATSEDEVPRPPGSDEEAGPTPPPSGWAAPGSGGPSDGTGGGGEQLEALLAALGSLRELVPPELVSPELQRRVTEALHELLLALRALIDSYIERIERAEPPPPSPDEAKDIPIL